MKEIWKDIKENPNYMVSNMGKVKSMEHYVFQKNRWGKEMKRLYKEKILKPSVNKKGYLYVGLWKEGKMKYCRVHRLEYEAFYGKIPDGMQVNHINEIKTDNRLENLNLMTPKENANWGTARERLIKELTNHPSYSKTVLQYDLDGNFIKEWPSTMEIQRQLDFKNTHISNCCKGGYFHKGRNKWVNVSQAYGYKWQYKKGDC